MNMSDVDTTLIQTSTGWLHSLGFRVLFRLFDVMSIDLPPID